MSSYLERKAERRDYYLRGSYGWVLKPCPACAGSGIYDGNGSPPCGACAGTGKVRCRGPKALSQKEVT